MATADQIIVGIDIGTTKVCAVAAESDGQGKINVLGIGLAESDGLNRGVVVNIDKTVASIQKAIDATERAADVEIQNVIVGIAGDHIKSYESTGVITIANQEISNKDVKRLLEDTASVKIEDDKEILHIIPQEFIVDSQDGVHDPVGMRGVRLKANVDIITGDVHAMKNIYRCIEKAGYHVIDVVLEPLASSFSVLHEDELIAGVALIDIGGGTTDVAVFEDHKIRHTAVIAIAGNNVTEDIRKGLGVMRNYAEQLKCQFGCAMVDYTDDQDQIKIPGLGGRPDKIISSSTLAQMIQPRLEEILEIAHLEIRRSKYAAHLQVAVLTGGGSKIPNIKELADEILGLDTRIGSPTKRGSGLWEEVSDPKYATGTGLVQYGLSPHFLGDIHGTGVGGALHSKGSGTGNFFAGIKRWFDEL